MFGRFAQPSCGARSCGAVMMMRCRRLSARSCGSSRSRSASSPRAARSCAGATARSARLSAGTTTYADIRISRLIPSAELCRGRVVSIAGPPRRTRWAPHNPGRSVPPDARPRIAEEGSSRLASGRLRDRPTAMRTMTADPLLANTGLRQRRGRVLLPYRHRHAHLPPCRRDRFDAVE